MTRTRAIQGFSEWDTSIPTRSPGPAGGRGCGASCRRAPSAGDYRDATRHGTTRHITSRHDAARHATQRHNTPQHNTALHVTSPHSMTLRTTPPHNTLQHDIAIPHKEYEMKAPVASVTIVGIAPMTHSHQHGEPKFGGRDASVDDYVRRTRRSKLNTEVRDGKQAHHGHPKRMASTRVLEAAARYSGAEITGQRQQATWTAKFSSGLALLANPIIRWDRSSDRQFDHHQRQRRWQTRQRQARATAVPGYPDRSSDADRRGLRSRSDNYEGNL